MTMGAKAAAQTSLSARSVATSSVERPRPGLWRTSYRPTSMEKGTPPGMPNSCS